MTAVWVKLLESILSALLKKLAGMDLNRVVDECMTFWNSGLTGDEKRRAVFNALKEIAGDCASQWLYAAIEVAVARIKREAAK